MMTARALLYLLTALAVALFAPGCVCMIPDSLSLSYRRQRSLATGRADRDEIGGSITYHLRKLPVQP